MLLTRMFTSKYFVLVCILIALVIAVKFVPILLCLTSNPIIVSGSSLYISVVYMSGIIGQVGCNLIIMGYIASVVYISRWLLLLCTFHARFYEWLLNMNRRKVVLSTTFLVMSAFGIGVWLSFIVMLLTRLKIVHACIKTHIMVRSCISYSGGDVGNQQRLPLTNLKNTNPNSTKERICGKRSLVERGLENCPGSEPPPKRGRKKVYGGHSCGECTVWLQTGSNEALKSQHKMDRVRHPGDKAAEFTEYLGMGGLYKNIILREDSCLCNACYIDCTRKTGKPRWYVYSKQLVVNHCFLCCDPSGSCQCESICGWGPSNCFSGEKIEHWLMYFKLNKYNVNDICGQMLCKRHYSVMRKEVQNRVCKMCKCLSSNTDSWVFGYFVNTLCG